jgi:rhodanese-related sulfurtransferase
MSKVKFITIEDLLEMKANNEKFKLVDVLEEEEFKKGHIPGAVNTPLEKLPTLAKIHLKKSDKIVVYCARYACQASTKAARTLLKMGYKKTLDFKAGKKGWLHMGLDLET